MNFADAMEGAHNPNLYTNSSSVVLVDFSFHRKLLFTLIVFINSPGAWYVVGIYVGMCFAV